MATTFTKTGNLTKPPGLNDQTFFSIGFHHYAFLHYYLAFILVALANGVGKTDCIGRHDFGRVDGKKQPRK